MSKSTFYLFLILGILFALLCLIFYPKWTVDDAFIIFRYADNFANFGQLNYNLNSTPVEGYTGILQLLLLAAAIKIGLSPIIASQILGVICFFLSLFLIMKILQCLNISKTAQIIVFFIFLLTPIVYTHIFSGLETFLFVTLLLLATWLFLISIRNLRSNLDIALFFTLFLLPLSRPEGAIFSLLLIISYFWKLLTSKDKIIYQKLVKVLLFFIAPAFTYFIVRYNYYGHLLPNTFYVKSIKNWINVITIKDFGKFAIRYWLFYGLIIVSLIAAAYSQVKNLSIELKNSLNKHVYFILIPILLFIIIIPIFYFRSKLTMHYGYRFFFPLYVVSLFLLAIGIDYCRLIILELRKKHLFRLVAVLLVASIFILAQMFCYAMELKKETHYIDTYSDLSTKQHIPIGKMLSEKFKDKDSILIVYDDAGAMPYYSKMKTIDFGRLNNIDLTHKHKDIESIVDYFYAQNASAVVITSFDWDKVVHNNEVAAIIKDPRFKQYKLHKKYKSNSPWGEYYEFVFIKE